MRYFNVATNLMQRFMIGYETEQDNFYISGQIVNDKPIISCRIYGPDGKFCFGLSNNNLTPDTPSKYRFQLTKEGWPWIYNDERKDLLTIREEEDKQGNKIIHILGEFFDKHGNLAARGDETGLLVNCPVRLG